MPDNRSFYPRVVVPMSAAQRAAQRLPLSGPCGSCHRTFGNRYGAHGHVFCLACRDARQRAKRKS